MPRIILSMSVSLDGFFEGPDRDISWHLVDDELHQHFNDECRAMAGFIDGRVTAELMADYWPTADARPESTPVEAEFARIWRDASKYVFSRTVETMDWNTTVLHDVTPERVAELQARAGGDLMLAGANLAATFMRLDLIDEYRLYVHPVVIGRGTPLFQSPDLRRTLRPLGTREFGNGVVQLRYERGGRPGAG